MAEEAIDVLMRVVAADGPLSAESGTQFARTASVAPLHNGFTPGFFCELREFEFSAGIGAAMEKKQKKAAKENKLAAGASQPERKLTLAEQQLKIADRQNAKILKREADVALEMQPVEYTRIMDAASTQLFKLLVECTTIEEINIVKRKAAGSQNSGEAYLRLDFKKCLMTELEWKDSTHVILETGTFIYREVTIRYRPQRPDGSLDAPKQANWKMKAARPGG